MSKNQTVLLITGANGLLGQKLVKRCIKQGIPFHATSKGPNRNPLCPDSAYSEIELTDPEEVRKLMQSVQPSAVIHTAAMTNVDQCESEPENCRLINVESTRCLLEEAIRVQAHFQLLSTDFVFDGLSGPYSETDQVNPLSIYAKSKVEAENLLLKNDYKNWSIARTIIVYGTGAALSRSNLILWAMQALPKLETMRLVDDQFRAPTWADDLAYGCVEIILRKLTGVFHLSGPKTMSVVEIVQVVAEALGIENAPIEHISSEILNQAAKRPPRTGFILDKAQQLLDYHPHALEKTIPILLTELQNSGL